ncbi:hypothetical protein ACA910_008521 [Epithemia clementina (nom. ined.)]
MKEASAELSSKDIIAIAAKQWKDLSSVEKAGWKAKAQAITQDDEASSDSEQYEDDQDEDVQHHQKIDRAQEADVATSTSNHSERTTTIQTKNSSGEIKEQEIALATSQTDGKPRTS